MSVSLPMIAEQGNGISQYLQELSKFPVLNREQEQDIAVRFYETGDRDAAQQLVVANLRFVVKIAYEYKSYGLRMSDLIQEGNVGLLMAVKKFDPHKGIRLISYAVWWIRAYIQNFVLKSWSLVRIGTTRAQRKLFYKLRSAKRKLLEASGAGNFDRALQSKEAHQIAEQYALHAADVIDMDARLSGRDVSLNVPVREDDGSTTHQDLLCAPDNQEELVANQQATEQLSQEVQQALTELNPREQFIVEKRLMAEEPLTLQAIGTHFSISRERVRQLEARAKQKLRQTLQAAA